VAASEATGAEAERRRLNPIVVTIARLHFALDSSEGGLLSTSARKGGVFKQCEGFLALTRFGIIAKNGYDEFKFPLE